MSTRPRFRTLGRDLAIDLGTANTLIHVRGRGVVVEEPSVVAVEVGTGRLVAAGSRAKEMLGRAPGTIRAVRPLRDGVVSDADETERMLRWFIDRVGTSRLVRPRMVLCVPERGHRRRAPGPRGRRDPLRRAAGLHDRGADGRRDRLRAARQRDHGEHGRRHRRRHDRRRRDQPRRHRHVQLAAHRGRRDRRGTGQPRQERVLPPARGAQRRGHQGRRRLGLPAPRGAHHPRPRPRPRRPACPRRWRSTSVEVRRAIEGPVLQIIELVRATLDVCPPELAGDVLDRGITLTGGGALLRGLDERMRHELGVPVRSPRTRCARSCGARAGASTTSPSLERVLVGDHPGLAGDALHDPPPAARPARRRDRRAARRRPRRLGRRRRRRVAPAEPSSARSSAPSPGRRPTRWRGSRPRTSDSARTNAAQARELEGLDRAAPLLGSGGGGRATASSAPGSSRLPSAPSAVAALTLDAGSHDGVVTDVTVVSADGLVGRVVAVSPWTCDVQVLGSAGSVVGVRVGTAGTMGTVAAREREHRRRAGPRHARALPRRAGDPGRRRRRAHPRQHRRAAVCRWARRRHRDRRRPRPRRRDPHGDRRPRRRPRRGRRRRDPAAHRAGHPPGDVAERGRPDEGDPARPRPRPATSSSRPCSAPPCCPASGVPTRPGARPRPHRGRGERRPARARSTAPCWASPPAGSSSWCRRWATRSASPRW